MEEAIEIMRNEFMPAKRHTDFVNSLCKLFTAAVAVAGGILGALRLLGAI